MHDLCPWKKEARYRRLRPVEYVVCALAALVDIDTRLMRDDSQGMLRVLLLAVGIDILGMVVRNILCLRERYGVFVVGLLREK
jgi:hypothetical protein